MNWLNKRCLLIAAIFFVLPIFIYPVRGSIGHSITTYTYGFPFSWLSVHFVAPGGRLFIWQALSSQPQGVQIDFITAILKFHHFICDYPGIDYCIRSKERKVSAKTS